MRAIPGRTVCALACTIFTLAVCETAQAIPILQLYVEGGTYDSTETWVATSSTGSFRIWAIGNVSGAGGKGTIYDVKLAAAYRSSLNLTITLTPSQVSTLSYPGIVDSSVPISPTWLQTSAAGAIPKLGDGSNLPSHGEYGSGVRFQEFALGNFTETSSSIADFITSFPTSFTTGGQINVYDVTISGHGVGDSVHFDLYNHVQAKNKSKYVFAPFSHDGEGTKVGQPPGPFEVPEPASVLLLMGGGLGMTAINRRRRRMR